MKHLYDYILEELTEKGEKTIKSLMKFMNDDDINDIKNIIYRNRASGKPRTAFLKKLSNMLNNKNIFKNGGHGFKDLSDKLLNIFKTNMKMLHKIVDDYTNYNNYKGQLSVFKFNGNIMKNDKIVEKYNGANGNTIYETFCNGWEKEAKALSTLTDVGGSANTGKFEMLLTFIFTDAISSNTGDVTIDGWGELEVKCKAKSGGHAAGQKGNIKSKNELVKSFYNNLLKDEKNVPINYYIFSTVKPRGKNYTDGGVYALAKIIKDILGKNANDNEINDLNDKLITALCNSVFDQYGITNNDTIIKNAQAYSTNFDKRSHNIVKLYYDLNFLDTPSKPQKQNNQAYKQEKQKYDKSLETYNNAIQAYKPAINELCNILGAIQLYAYAVVESTPSKETTKNKKNGSSDNTHNFAIICIDSTNENVPKFRLLAKEDLLDIKTTLDCFRFLPLDSNEASQSRTGKMEVIFDGDESNLTNETIN